MLAEVEILREEVRSPAVGWDGFEFPDEFDWWFFPIAGEVMQKVNLPVFYSFGAKLRALMPINTSDEITDRETLIVFFGAKGALQGFLSATTSMTFPHSKEVAESLIVLIDEFVEMADEAIEAKDIARKFPTNT